MEASLHAKKVVYMAAKFGTALRAELMLASGKLIGQIQGSAKLKVTGFGRLHHFTHICRRNYMYLHFTHFVPSLMCRFLR
jgi:hypothetical protein